MLSQTPIVFTEGSLLIRNRIGNSRDEMKLSSYSWSVNRDGAPKTTRTLIILHGFGEYGGRYAHSVEKFLKTFDSVRTYDQRGHGKSPGLRGHFSSLENLAHDFWHFYAKCLVDDCLAGIRSDYVVLGHSFGGLVLLSALENPSVRSSVLDWFKASNSSPVVGGKDTNSQTGSSHHDLASILGSRDFFDRYNLPMNLVFSAPLLGVKVEAPLWKKGLGRVLSRFGATSALQLTNEIDAAQLSHDPKNTENYLADKLIHHNITPLAYSEMLRAIENCRQRTAVRWGIPKHSKVLVQIPMSDSIVDSTASKNFFAPLVSCSEKESLECKIIQYDGLYHEIFNELDQSPYVDLDRWVRNLK